LRLADRLLGTDSIPSVDFLFAPAPSIVAFLDFGASVYVSRLSSGSDWPSTGLALGWVGVARDYRLRIRQAEAMGEFVLSEVLREIAVQKQEHLTDLATALGLSSAESARFRQSLDPSVRWRAQAPSPRGSLPGDPQRPTSFWRFSG
jgi:hypothetical protein